MKFNISYCGHQLEKVFCVLFKVLLLVLLLHNREGYQDFDHQFAPKKKYFVYIWRKQWLEFGTSTMDVYCEDQAGVEVKYQDCN